MPPLPRSKQMIVESAKDFDTVLHQYAVVVDFANKKEKEKYSDLDSKIADEIQELMIEIFGKKNESVLFHQNLDWWPNCTRFLEIDSVCVTWLFINRLMSLLIGELKDFRVNIHVYTPLKAKKKNHVGGLNVYSDWILIQRSVLELLPKSR